MKKGTLRSQAGFSLVELMVVVAIIGVLAAMSAGQVQRQIAKARQSEAKTNLGTLWSALEAFKAEFNSYTTDFQANKLSYSGKLYYHVGFSANHVASAGLGGYSGASSTAAYNTAQNSATITCVGCAFMPGAGAPTGTAAAANTFTATARGQVYNSTDDIWQITQAKRLTNPTDGIQ